MNSKHFATGIYLAYIILLGHVGPTTAFTADQELNPVLAATRPDPAIEALRLQLEAVTLASCREAQATIADGIQQGAAKVHEIRKRTTSEMEAEKPFGLEFSGNAREYNDAMEAYNAAIRAVQQSLRQIDQENRQKYIDDIEGFFSTSFAGQSPFILSDAHRVVEGDMTLEEAQGKLRAGDEYKGAFAELVETIRRHEAFRQDETRHASVPWDTFRAARDRLARAIENSLRLEQSNLGHDDSNSLDNNAYLQRTRALIIREFPNSTVEISHTESANPGFDVIRDSLNFEDAHDFWSRYGSELAPDLQRSPRYSPFAIRNSMTMLYELAPELDPVYIRSTQQIVGQRSHSMVVCHHLSCAYPFNIAVAAERILLRQRKECAEAYARERERDREFLGIPYRDFIYAIQTDVPVKGLPDGAAGQVPAPVGGGGETLIAQ